MGPSLRDWISDLLEVSLADRRYREVREFTLDPTPELQIDATPNGGILVQEGPPGAIHVRATVTALDSSLEDAEALAHDVHIEALPGEIRSTGPQGLIGLHTWSVSYEVLVPGNTDLVLRSTNGRLAVEGVQGSLDLETTNGAIELRAVNGPVQARTSNGGISIALDSGPGQRGIRARTTNGGIRLVAPHDLAADLEAETTNGGISVDWPVPVEGRIGRRLRARLGAGGPLIHLTTTNGGVRIHRR